MDVAVVEIVDDPDAVVETVRVVDMVFDALAVSVCVVLPLCVAVDEMDVVADAVEEGVAVPVAVLVNVTDCVADAELLNVGDVVDDPVAVNEAVNVAVLDMVDEALMV